MQLYFSACAPECMQHRYLIQRMHVFPSCISANNHIIYASSIKFTPNQSIYKWLNAKKLAAVRFFKLPVIYKSKTLQHSKPNDAGDHAVVIAYALTVKQNENKKTNPKTARPHCAQTFGRHPPKR